MFTGVVHGDKDGTIWFEDVPVRSPDDLPRRKAWKGTIWYATGTITPSMWAAVMGPSDQAFGPAPGQLLGVSFKVGSRGRFRVLNASTWGVRERDPDRCYYTLRDLMIQAAAAGAKVKSSVAATAMRIYLDRFDGKPGYPKLRQLPCRWRGLAHAALHGGPIAVLKGGAPFAVQIDVRKAYLAALREPVPVMGTEDGGNVGGWFTHDDRRWDKIRSLTGFVDATVWVHGDLRDPAGLPPLPVHLPSGSAYPTGRLRGVWTVAQVRDAEERSEVVVEKVHQFAFAPQTRPLFAEVAALFEEFPQPLSKFLYTRFWGKFGSRGGYLAQRSEEPRQGDVPAAGLWWRYDGVPLDSFRAPATYRPDLAAFVCAASHRNVMRTIRTLKPGSVVAAHVDAIWTTDLVGAAMLCAQPDKIGSWRQKRIGPLRFYGHGAYAHDDRLAASGYDSGTFGKLTRERLETWIQTGATRRKLLLQSRDWSRDPAFESDAVSKPLHIQMDLRNSPAEGPGLYDGCWTMSGWMRPVEQPEEPVEVGPPGRGDNPHTTPTPSGVKPVRIDPPGSRPGASP